MCFAGAAAAPRVCVCWIPVQRHDGLLLDDCTARRCQGSIQWVDPSPAAPSQLQQPHTRSIRCVVKGLWIIPSLRCCADPYLNTHARTHTRRWHWHWHCHPSSLRLPYTHLHRHTLATCTLPLPLLSDCLFACTLQSQSGTRLVTLEKKFLSTSGCFLQAPQGQSASRKPA